MPGALVRERLGRVAAFVVGYRPLIAVIGKRARQTASIAHPLFASVVNCFPPTPPPPTALPPTPPGRCDTEESEEEVKKRSATKDAMGAKTLCIPLEQVWRRSGV